MSPRVVAFLIAVFVILCAEAPKYEHLNPNNTKCEEDMAIDGKLRDSPFGKDELRNAIEDALRKVNLYSEGLTVLLMGTAATESEFGLVNKQNNGGPARGIFQMEPVTHDGIWSAYLKFRPDLARAIEAEIPAGMTRLQALEESVPYQAIMAGVLYQWRAKSFPASGDVAGLASTWKRYWNTPKGKGTEAKFVEKFNEYCVAAR